MGLRDKLGSVVHHDVRAYSGLVKMKEELELENTIRVYKVKCTDKKREAVSVNMCAVVVLSMLNGVTREGRYRFRNVNGKVIELNDDCVVLYGRMDCLECGRCTVEKLNGLFA